ncbi:MAG: matrixin family metalloprotease [Myxococcota bacterium]|nr:matrixin family metalloprotease [Myxococcota bacterium]
MKPQSRNTFWQPFWSVAICLLVQLFAWTSHGFDTLDIVKSRWSPNGVAEPSYSIGRLSPNLPEIDQVNAINASFAAWANVPGANLRFRPENNGGEITLDFRAAWPREFGQYAAGVTITNRRNGRIFAAQISFNEQNFTWAIDGNAIDTDLQSVATHEIGHAIGFGHSFYRDATMYWTGIDVDMRVLAEDDQRAARYLYGNRTRLGLMCDTCTSNNECAAGGICARLRSNRAYCGQSCEGGCPDHSQCFRLDGGGEACFPTAGDCSDEAAGEFSLGDYCFGSDQCGQNARCVPTEDSALCAQICIPGRNDCRQGRCMRTGDNEGVCIQGGPIQFAGPCEQSTDCSSLLCMPIGEDEQLCTTECSLQPDTCPEGRCIATGVDDFPYVCVPPGSLEEAQPCATERDRCRPGLTCIQEGENAVCRAECEAFGQCERGDRRCSPLSPAAWYCRPLSGSMSGQPCTVWSDCQGGLFCAPLGLQDEQFCTEPCEVGQAGQCGGRGCTLVSGSLGGCSVGEKTIGDACMHRSECADAACIPTANGQICSQVCSDNLPCPDAWDCLRIGTGESVCFPPNNFGTDEGDDAMTGSTGGMTPANDTPSNQDAAPNDETDNGQGMASNNPPQDNVAASDSDQQDGTNGSPSTSSGAEQGAMTNPTQPGNVNPQQPTNPGPGGPAGGDGFFNRPPPSTGGDDALCALSWGGPSQPWTSLGPFGLLLLWLVGWRLRDQKPN